MEPLLKSKKQIAKLLLQDKRFSEAKKIILEMIKISGANGSVNNKTFIKLGDVCMELNEYDEALKYILYKVRQKHNLIHSIHNVNDYY